MSTPPSSLTRADVSQALHRVDAPELEAYLPLSETSLMHVGDGVNDVFLVSTPQRDDRLVAKFGTYSEPEHLRAGVAAYLLLAEFTDLPVPGVVAFDEGDDETPPFVLMEHRPGEALADGFPDTERATNPDAVRLLGAVIAAFGSIPPRATDGYGYIQRTDFRDGSPVTVGECDHCSEWLVDYGTELYEAAAAHEELDAIVPDVFDYLQASRDRVSEHSSQAILITDFSPANLMSRDGTPPAGVDELTGVIDLERAKVGPLEFAAVNAEYLLTRYIDDRTRFEMRSTTRYRSARTFHGVTSIACSQWGGRWRHFGFGTTRKASCTKSGRESSPANSTESFADSVFHSESLP